MLSMDFDPCFICPAIPESAACLSCTLYMDDGFDDDKEKPFENIDIDGSPVNSWTKEDDDENNQYLAYCSGL